MTKNTALTFTVLPGLGGKGVLNHGYLMISIQTIYHISYIIYGFIYLYIRFVFCFFPENTLSKGSKMDRGPVFTTKRSIRY